MCLLLQVLLVPADPSSDVIERVDLGNRFLIGDLYNARNDNRVDGRLWKAEDINSRVLITNLQNTDANLKIIANEHDKTELFELDASLTASVLFSLASVKGSAKYLKENVQQFLSVSAGLQVHTALFRQTFENVFHEGLSHQLNDTKDATHVVTGVTWGMTCFAEFSKTFSRHEDKNSYHLQLEIVLNLLFFKLHFDKSFDEHTYRDFITKDFSVHVKCDPEVHGKPSGDNISEVMDFLRKLPSKAMPKGGIERCLGENPVPNACFGTSVPKKVQLTPLAALPNLQAARVARVQTFLDEDVLRGSMKMLSSLPQQLQTINDMLELENYHPFAAWKSMLKTYQKDMEDYYQKSKSELGHTLERIRGGQGHIADLTVCRG